MKKLIIFLVFTTLFACNKSNEPEVYDGGVYLYTAVEFSIYNLQNEDLLNSENPNYLDDIKLFYEIDGEKKEVYNQGSDNPKGFMIFKHENEYRIRVSLNHTETSDKPITYIQWNDSDIDTVEITIKRTQNSILQDEIWLNGIQVWEFGDGNIDPYFVLIK